LAPLTVAVQVVEVPEATEFGVHMTDVDVVVVETTTLSGPPVKGSLLPSPEYWTTHW
jgi:hypothetical protein